MSEELSSAGPLVHVGLQAVVQEVLQDDQVLSLIHLSFLFHNFDGADD